MKQRPMQPCNLKASLYFLDLYVSFHLDYEAASRRDDYAYTQAHCHFLMRDHYRAISCPGEAREWEEKALWWIDSARKWREIYDPAERDEMNTLLTDLRAVGLNPIVLL